MRYVILTFHRLFCMKYHPQHDDEIQKPMKTEDIGERKLKALENLL